MAEALDSDSTKDAATAPKKRSLFTKAVGAKPVEQKEGIDFFSRADEIWASRVADEERRRQKALVKMERKRSSISADRKCSTSPDKKKRCLSQKEGFERHSSEVSLSHEDPDSASRTRRESMLSTPGSRKSFSSSSQQKPQVSPTTFAGKHATDLLAQSKDMSGVEVASKVYISLSDSDEAEDSGYTAGAGLRQLITLDDDEDDIVAVAPKPTGRPKEDPEMSDEEFPELAEEARQREKLNALERLKTANLFENQNHAMNTSNTQNHTVDDIFEDRSTISDDPIVEIFVSSWIDGSNPLMIRRKLSQRLKEVRLAWCDRQLISGEPFPRDVKDSIFLTWKGKKLYDVTNCKSLCPKQDGSGHLFLTGEGYMEGKIHLEAWTQDLYDKHQRELEAKQAHGYDEDEPEEVVEVSVDKIRLFMTAKGMEPFRIKVNPATTFRKMIIAFCNATDVPEGKDVALYFDGDKLDPESKVADTDLDDRDTVEVHIK